jgi:hypothetical protein
MGEDERDTSAVSAEILPPKPMNLNPTLNGSGTS